MKNLFDIVVQGDIVLSERVISNGMIGITAGKMAYIAETGDVITGKQQISALGQYVMPGAIDAHVHCYSSLDEGFTNASKAAAAGGVTTIIEMPYDATGIISTEALLQAKITSLNKESLVDIALLATLAKEGSLEEIFKLAASGVCGFKVSMFNTDSFRFPRIDDARLYEAFALIAQTGCPVGVHAENDEIVRSQITRYKHLGENPLAHAWSRPKVAESTAALVALELAYTTGVKLHIYHATFPRIFELVEFFRSQGTRVTAETCTHYLTLNETDLTHLQAKAKINPPLRTSEDVEGLWELISKGRIDFITSDHAPWLISKKTDPNIFKNSSGAAGVENLLPMIYSEGVAKKRITIFEMIRLLAEKPAKTFGLDYCKGKIAIDMDADLVILDPNISYVMDERELNSSAGWSPYEGWEMQGKVTHTLVRGEIIYQHTIVGKPGDGRFVPARHLI